MATPGFQVYQDKENVSSIGSFPKSRNRHGAAPGKSAVGVLLSYFNLKSPTSSAGLDAQGDSHLS